MHKYWQRKFLPYQTILSIIIIIFLAINYAGITENEILDRAFLENPPVISANGVLDTKSVSPNETYTKLDNQIKNIKAVDNSITQEILYYKEVFTVKDTIIDGYVYYIDQSNWEKLIANKEPEFILIQFESIDILHLHNVNKTLNIDDDNFHRYEIPAILSFTFDQNPVQVNREMLPSVIFPITDLPQINVRDDIEWLIFSYYFLEKDVINEIERTSEVQIVIDDISNKLNKIFVIHTLYSPEINSPLLSIIYSINLENIHEFNDIFSLFFPFFIFIEILFLILYNIFLKDQREIFNLLIKRGYSHNKLSRKLWGWSVGFPTLISIVSILAIYTFNLISDFKFAIFLNRVLPWIVTNLIASTILLLIFIKDLNKEMNNINISKDYNIGKIFGTFALGSILIYLINLIMNIFGENSNSEIMKISSFYKYSGIFIVMSVLAIIFFFIEKVKVNMKYISVLAIRKNKLLILLFVLMVSFNSLTMVNTEIENQIHDEYDSYVGLMGDVMIKFSDPIIANDISIESLSTINEIQYYLPVLTKIFNIHGIGFDLFKQILIIEEDLYLQMRMESEYSNLSQPDISKILMFIPYYNSLTALDEVYINDLNKSVLLTNNDIGVINSNPGLISRYNTEIFMTSDEKWENTGLSTQVSSIDKYQILISLQEDVSLNYLETQISDILEIPSSVISISRVTLDKDHHLSHGIILNTVHLVNILTNLIIVIIFTRFIVNDASFIKELSIIMKRVFNKKVILDNFIIVNVTTLLSMIVGHFIGFCLSFLVFTQSSTFYTSQSINFPEYFEMQPIYTNLLISYLGQILILIITSRSTLSKILKNART